MKLSDFSATSMQLLFSLRLEEAALELKLNDFSATNMQLFFSLDRRSCFRATLSDLSATNTQLFFLAGSKRLPWSKVERYFSHTHAAVFSLWIEEAALE